MQAMRHRKLTSLARVALVLLQEAEALGFDGDSRSSKPHAPDPKDPDARVPLSVLSGVWRHLLTRDSDPSLGLRLGQRLTIRSLGIVGYAMATRATLGDALDCLSHYYGLLREGIDCRVERDVEQTTIVLHDRDMVGWAVRQQIDTRLAAVLMLCRQLTDQDVVPSAVEFPYRRPQELDEHRRTFGIAELRFERSEAALILPTTDLVRPIGSADDTLGGYLDRLATDMLTELEQEPSAGSFADEIARALASTLGSGLLRIDGIGALLGVSTRTIQRRLRTEGTTFAVVLQQLRRRHAEGLLRDRRMTIEQVAGHLGYSEASTFYRAFRRWRGTSPGAFRAQTTVRRIDVLK
jgi:AraC-like DNA-binding protein